MKKVLLILALAALAVSAANAKVVAHTVTLSSNGTTFCDFFTNMNLIAPYAGGPAIGAYASHDLSTNCGDGIISVAGGFKHGLSKLIPPFSSPVIDLGDDVDALLGANIAQSYQFFITKTACNWSTYYTDGTTLYFFIDGTCSTTAPAHEGGPSSIARQ